MKFLSVETLPSAIYCGSSTQNKFCEEKFTPLNMKSCGRHSVGKHREIVNGDQYIFLEISLYIGYLDNS